MKEEDELKEKTKRLEKELKEKDAVIKGQEGIIRVLERKAGPRSLSFYRSRFNAPSKS